MNIPVAKSSLITYLYESHIVGRVPAGKKRLRRNPFGQVEKSIRYPWKRWGTRPDCRQGQRMARPYRRTVRDMPDNAQSLLRASSPHHHRQGRSAANHRDMMACYCNAALRRRRRSSLNRHRHSQLSIYRVGTNVYPECRIYHWASPWLRPESMCLHAKTMPIKKSRGDAIAPADQIARNDDDHEQRAGSVQPRR